MPPALVLLSERRLVLVLVLVLDLVLDSFLLRASGQRKIEDEHEDD